MRKHILSYASEDFIKQLFALEDLSDGVTRVEIEYVIYAKLDDFSLLEKADSFELQEQWEIKIPKTHDNVSAGRIRIRKTDKAGKVDFVQTTKTAVPEGEKETSLKTTEDAFVQFKQLALSGMVKKRYIFPVDNSPLKWEVDVFILPNGDLSPYVKIDLEVNKKLDTLPPLPIGFSEIISNQKGNQTVEERERIQKLYSTVFLRRNEYVKRAPAVESFSKHIRNY